MGEFRENRFGKDNKQSGQSPYKRQGGPYNGNRGGGFKGPGGQGSRPQQNNLQSSAYGSWAPYNFVPFHEKVLKWYDSPQDLPPHDCYMSGRLSGEINISAVTETYTYISNGQKEAGGFYKNAAGHPALPGSSIRGLVRGNMQILGYGYVGDDVADDRFFFRNIMGKVYQREMNITSGSNAGARYSEVKNAKPGLLRQKGGKYEIAPLSQWYWASKRDAGFRNKEGTLGTGYFRPMANSTPPRKAEFSRDKQAGYQECLFMVPGPMSSANHVYLFPKETERQPPIELSQEDVAAYQADYEFRINSLKQYGDAMLNLCALPEDGEEKPVFYTRLNNHYYWGITQFMRIGHRHSVHDGLPESQKPGKDAPPLDCTRAMMGFIGEKYSYRSRLSFFDLVLQGEERVAGSYSVVLGAPKASDEKNYLQDGQSYSSNQFQLRGAKQYWMKEPNEQELRSQSDNENIATTLKPLKPGSKFIGTVRFVNLSQEELGLLLYSIRLDENCRQNVGQGKPFGFGRIAVNIDALHIYEPDTMYATDGFHLDGVRDDTQSIPQYIQDYNSWLQNELNAQAIHEDDSIKAFLKMKTTLIKNADAVSYMELGGFGDRQRKPLKSVKEVADHNGKKFPPVGEKE